MLRTYDTVARIGGDEFTVILEGIGTREELESILTRVESVLDGPYDIYGETFHTSASVGALVYDRLKEKFGADELDENELLRAVDRAMYDAKGLPGTRWSRPEPRDLQSGEHIQKASRLRRAIEHDRMVPHYQPIIALDDDRMIGVEALARWNLPDGGTRRASEFLETADRMGHLWAISRQVYRRAFRDLERWRAESSEELSLFLNLSPPGFEQREVFELLNSLEIPAPAVVFEITEQDLLRNPDRIQGLLERQFRVAVDDFGTGYSSFEYLKRFDVDCLKIDMTYVQGALEDVTDRAILETICGLAQKLGLSTIGEGVEEESHPEQLVDFGCGHAQGYLFGHAAPGPEVEKRLFGEPLSRSTNDALPET